jgi:hypothetical protein
VVFTVVGAVGAAVLTAVEGVVAEEEAAATTSRCSSDVPSGS